MPVKTANISLNTHAHTDIQDITRELTRLVEESGLKAGTLTVFCPSSTSGLTTLEFEPGATWHGGNGHSHMRAALLGPSLTIPFVEKTLTLGTWQQVIYVDFDIRPRHRELVVQMVGD
jgi:thiamine phosphate synthase YjbQ (UPF0047 family)